MTTRINWAVYAATFTSLVVAVLSILLVLEGIPVSGIVVQCTPGAPCSQAQLSSREAIEPLFAAIPLVLGAAVALGLARRWMFVAWPGTMALVFFSVLTGFSIGLYFLPFALALLGLTGFLQSSQKTKTKSP